MLNGEVVDEVLPDLEAASSSKGVQITKASHLSENVGVAFQGPVKVGSFDIDGESARSMLLSRGNPNGRPNSDVIRPWANGMDITRRSSDTWIIDFADMPIDEASLYEAPMRHLVVHVKPERDKNRDRQRRDNWWRLGRSGADLRAAVALVDRFVITTRVAKHRVFTWMSKRVLPDSRLVAIVRDDDTHFGILHSRFHELWTLRLGNLHGGERPQYTPSQGFETYPFPQGLSPNIPAKDYANDPRAQKIAAAAERLNELREAWLNPPDLVKREPEVVPGYPDRILPKDAKAAATLKKRTLTNLYNERPAWLANAHKDLDEAVAAAYGWPADLSDEEILKERAKAQGASGKRKSAKVEAE